MSLPLRIVKVDLGYGHAENIQTVEVIREDERKGVFDGKPYRVLLVELLDRTRIWVDQWEECTVQTQGETT